MISPATGAREDTHYALRTLLVYEFYSLLVILHNLERNVWAVKYVDLIFL